MYLEMCSIRCCQALNEVYREAITVMHWFTALKPQFLVAWAMKQCLELQSKSHKARPAVMWRQSFVNDQCMMLHYMLADLPTYMCEYAIYGMSKWETVSSACKTAVKNACP